MTRLRAADAVEDKRLRKHCPELTVRMSNVVDVMTRQPQSEHPHGLSDDAFNTLFTEDKPLIVACHGYPVLIHRLTCRRTNRAHLPVRGDREEGTTPTPFDMSVLNDLKRCHLVADAIDRVPQLGPKVAYATQAGRDKLLEHKQDIATDGEGLPDIRHWTWSVSQSPATTRQESTR